ncbi:PepSY-associated TM helix domain-containing protein [Flavisphingomonas formosensis]|uniref:PepSY-associated TM helix domain-containing protein n=1 Tax=Flavisphingomonas formosensis TaxID=861534 RepID=UPI0012F80840|nr:PepSY-associated TM helix domain-containing protein [Sphingomonas formosensis]
MSRTVCPRSTSKCAPICALEYGGQRPLLFDGQSGLPKDAGRPKPPGIVGLLLAVHGELLAGLPGRLFIAAVGATALLSVISGIMIYAPFAAGRPFGDIRVERSRRLAWLDRHNVIGIASAAWLLVVTATGFMNAIERPLSNAWRAGISRTLPTVESNGMAIGPDEALATARRVALEMKFETVIFPGKAPGIPGYYLVWGSGTTTLTKRLTAPVAINALTGKPSMAGALPVPWYLRLLDVSRPLHFGDYGGLPLKILWALLDVVTILVLGSGLYLWLARRRRATPAAQSQRSHGAGLEPEPAK